MEFHEDLRRQRYIYWESESEQYHRERWSRRYEERNVREFETTGSGKSVFEKETD
jgi:hypothetical protein